MTTPSAPKPPLSPVSPKVIALLKAQEENGSWQPSIHVSIQVGKKIMQVTSSATAAYRKHPIPNRDDSKELFTTLMAMEYLSRHLPEDFNYSEGLSSNWKEKGEEFANTKASEDVLVHWREKAKWLFDGDKNANATTTCDVCGTVRPLLLKFCSVCFNQQNEHLKMQSVEKNDYTFNPKNTPASINNIPWDNIVGCHWIPGGLGSFGVIAVELPDGIIICKCAGNLFMSEYYGNIIGKLLKLNVPNMRIVPRECSEGQDFLMNVRKAPFSHDEDVQRISKYTLFPAFFVMDYIPTQKTFITSPEEAKEWFSNNDFLKQLSNMMAFDILINNFDRMPTIWQNQGNPNNILVNVNNNNPNIVCIDQFVSSVVDPFYTKYQNSMKEMINLCKDSKEKGKLTEELKSNFSYLQEFLNNNLLVNLDDSQLYTISLYLLESLDSMSTTILETSQESLLEGENEYVKALYADKKLYDFIQRVSHSCKSFLSE